MRRTYKIFISHAWDYDDDYYGVENLLQGSSLDWMNLSVPSHDKIHDARNRVELLSALEREIRSSDCVLIVSGMYCNHRFWIQREIAIAQHQEKPIIGIYLRGQLRAPRAVRAAAWEMVGWNTNSIVSAIRGWCRAKRNPVRIEFER